MKNRGERAFQDEEMENGETSGTEVERAPPVKGKRLLGGGM